MKLIFTTLPLLVLTISAHAFNFEAGDRVKCDSYRTEIKRLRVLRVKLKQCVSDGTQRLAEMDALVMNSHDDDLGRSETSRRAFAMVRRTMADCQSAYDLGGEMIETEKRKFLEAGCDQLLKPSASAENPAN